VSATNGCDAERVEIYSSDTTTLLRCAKHRGETL